VTEKNGNPAYSSSFLHALQFASHIHASQRRKGSGVPYLSHLMAVGALVLDYGGSETEAIGALLHDAAEDWGGREMLERVRTTFGDRVAEIVEGCTDTFEDPKPAWRPRKEAYIRRLHEAPESVRLVACADKLHNLLCTVRDLRANPGADYWQRFSAGRESQLWYYAACFDVFRSGKPPAMLLEYEIVWLEFVELADGSVCS
jgi:(p)ppGpp synthase/HD superfamily hydrolase